MNDPAALKPVRKRRTWYRRRLRNRRILAVSVLVVATVAVCWQIAAHFLPLPKPDVSSLLPDSFTARPRRKDLAWQTAQSIKRPVYMARIPGIYPYSVIPGGVKSSEALRQAVARDWAVGRHFSHFDYNRAHLLQLQAPREVYVSYRIRDTIFWTRKKIRLPVGEMLLTDGKITARAKCGNQISETPQPEVSNEEPEEAVLDQAVALEPLGPSFPIRPKLDPPDLPIGQPIAPALFGGGFTFPFVGVAGNIEPYCSTKNGELDKKCHPHHKQPVVPEPSSVILIASGLAVILWRCGRTRHTAAA